MIVKTDFYWSAELSAEILIAKLRNCLTWLQNALGRSRERLKILTHFSKRNVQLALRNFFNFSEAVLKIKLALAETEVPHFPYSLKPQG